MHLRNRLLNLYYNLIHSGGRDGSSKNVQLLALEGMMLAAIVHLSNGNFSLYATRLGATDFQLSLVSALPPLMGMIFLIPSAILVDRFSNKKAVVMGMIFTYGVLYLLISSAPLFKENAIIVFLCLLPLASIPFNLYSSSWQSYFFDIMPSEKRNASLTVRTMATFAMNISLPLITGQVLAHAMPEHKVRIHQIFLILCFFVAVAQLMVLSKTTAPEVPPKEKVPITLGQVKNSIVSVFANKKFLFFLAPMLLFHMSWHIDWSLHFITQIRYFGANEAWLSYINISGNLMQFIFVRFWSKLNQRTSVKFTLIFGAIGFTMYAPLVVINLLIPQQFALWFNLVSFGISNAFMAAFTLCAFQALLEVIPKNGNSTLNISVYNVLILLSNCVMPVVGVKLYSVLGSDRQAAMYSFAIVFVFRFISAVGIFARWKFSKTEPY